MIRRRRMPPELATAYDAFLAVLEELEPAKAALTEVLPGTRSPGRPLPDALAVFEAGLTRADARMPGWRIDALAPQWDACSVGIRTCLAGAASAEGADPAGFESLLWLVEALLDPLDPFVDAERAFLDLRR
jgi:hypothetical protein